MRVLVTGGTGTLGPHITAVLREQGVRVAALVGDRVRAERMLGPSVDLVEGSFADQPVLTEALEGSDTLVLLTPHGPDMAAVQITLIGQAAKIGTRVVKISGTSAGIGPDGPEACRQQDVCEQHLAAAGIAWAVLRPNGFMQTLVAGMAGSVRERGIVANPLGGVGIAVVDCADVGAATATVVCDQSLDGRCHVLTGPTAPTYADIAEIISQATGCAISTTPVTPEQVGEAARANGLSAWEANHLIEMLHLFRTGAAGTVVDDLPQLLGRPARTVRDYVSEQQALFRA